MNHILSSRPNNGDPVANLLERLEGVKQAGDGKWMARCPGPGHDDRHASLSIGTGDDGRVLLKCQAGCETSAIVAATGLRMADLFPPRINGNGHRNGKASPARRIVTAYDYRDERGTLLYQSVRYVPKNFRQRRPDGKGGWIWNLDGVRRVLYRLPELLVEALDRPEDWRFIAEGEKDVDRLRSIGLIATCNVFGASKSKDAGKGKWRDEYSPFLRGCRVAIIPDNDEPGRAHAQQIARSLEPHASEIRIVKLEEIP